MLDTMKRVRELAQDHGLSIYQLAEQCEIPYSTLKSTKARSGQLNVDTIERICDGLEIPLYAFFLSEGREKAS